MNILVTGANGQLGNAMRALAEGSQHRFIFTDVAGTEKHNTVHLDITHSATVRALVTEERIDAIVNCAAYTNVEKAETDHALCTALNAQAPEHLAWAMKEVGGLLIHISTDYVFGGEPYNTPCNEKQQGTPTGTYGLTKLQGEQRIGSTGCKHVIIRTSWLYSEHGKNFLKTMLTLTAEKPELKVVFDQVGTPTYAYDLAVAIMAVVNDYERERARFHENPREHSNSFESYSKAGIYHFSNEGVCSWYDFAKMIAAYAGHTSCNILPCHSCEFPSIVKRPAYSVLDKTKIKQAFGLQIPYWTDSLRRCLDNIL